VPHPTGTCLALFSSPKTLHTLSTQNDVSQCCSRETRSIPWRITIPLTVEALSRIQLGSRLCGNTPFYTNIRTRWANVTKNVCRNRRCMSNVAEMQKWSTSMYQGVDGGEGINTQCLEGGVRAIKAVFVRSLVIIGIFLSNPLAAVEVGKHPTWGTNQVWVLS
jgi:hypothetical protein